MIGLVIDDDPIACAVLSNGLRRLGFEDVLVADNGAIAKDLYAANANRISLVTCDLHMPDSDGIEYIQFLSAQKARCPLIIMSGAGDVLVRSAVALTNVHGLKLLGALNKPIDLAEVTKLVGEIDGLTPQCPSQLTQDCQRDATAARSSETPSHDKSTYLTRYATS